MKGDPEANLGTDRHHSGGAGSATGHHPKHLSSSEDCTRANMTLSRTSSIEGPPAKRLRPRSKPDRSSPGIHVAATPPARRSARTHQNPKRAAKDSSDRTKPGSSMNSTSPQLVSPAAPTAEEAIDPSLGQQDMPLQDRYGDLASYYIASGEDVQQEPQGATLQARCSAPAEADDVAPVVIAYAPPPRTRSLPPSALLQAKQGPMSTGRHAAVACEPGSTRASGGPVPTACGASLAAELQFAPLGHGSLRPRRLAIQWIDIAHDHEYQECNTVAGMLAILERLSSALAKCGGLPPPPAAPKPSPKRARTSSMEPPEPSHDLESYLSAGAVDEQLTRGLQFLQYALRAWAQRRLAQDISRAYDIEFQRYALSLGWPQPHRSFGTGDNGDAPLTVPCDLSKTPEGEAIQAIQAVLHHGLFRINVALPAEISEAVAQLYVQIDNLINQEQRSRPPWHCMSYGAQIAAHRSRLEHWKAAQARTSAGMVQVFPPTRSFEPVGHAQHGVVGNDRSMRRRETNPSASAGTRLSRDGSPRVAPVTGHKTGDKRNNHLTEQSSRYANRVQLQAVRAGDTGKTPLEIDSSDDVASDDSLRASWNC